MQRKRRERPELLGKPLAFCASDARVERVVACSAEARRLGVAVGMKAPDAQGLAGPGRLTLLPHTPGADRRALERLAAEFERFSPSVAIEDALYPEAILADATGLAPLWGEGGEARLVDAVQQWAAGKRLVAVVSLAPTLGLAIAATRYVAPTAGPVILTTENASAFAAELPVEALRVDEPTTNSLQRLGVESVGQLLALPRASLPSRFGAELARRLDQLLGDAPEPVESFRGEAPIASRWEFESAVSCAETLAGVRRRLFEDLAEQMAHRRCGALRVLVEHLLDARGAAPVRVVLRLFRPTASAEELADLTTLHLDGVRFTHAVRCVHALVGSSAPIEARQRTLFDNDPRDDPHTLALLVNRLANRVGADRVVRVSKRQSIDPRRAFAVAPATDAPAQAYAMTPLQSQKARQLPLQVFPETEPIRVETNEQGEPALLFFQGPRSVARCWGPERIETGWWRGRGLRRDAWWVELEEGALLWLHCDLRRREWRLAGEM